MWKEKLNTLQLRMSQYMMHVTIDSIAETCFVVLNCSLLFWWIWESNAQLPTSLASSCRKLLNRIKHGKVFISWFLVCCKLWCVEIKSMKIQTHVMVLYLLTKWGMTHHVIINLHQGGYVFTRVRFFVGWFVCKHDYTKANDIQQNLVEGWGIGQGCNHSILVPIRIRGQILDSFFTFFSIVRYGVFQHFPFFLRE